MRNVLNALLRPWLAVILMMCFGLWLNAIWPTLGIPNHAGITTNLVTVVIMLPFVWNRSHVRHWRELLLWMLVMQCMNGVLVGAKSIAYLWGQADHVSFHVSSLVEVVGTYTGVRPSELEHFVTSGQLLSIPTLLWFIQACVSAPLWEELFRGYAHRALKVVHFPVWLRVFLVAFWFAIIHKGSMISAFPGFILLGLLVERGYSWPQRALFHATANALTLVDALTIYLGGTRLDSYVGMFMSLGSQVVLLLALGIFTLSTIRKKFDSTEGEAKDARSYVFNDAKLNN